MDYSLELKFESPSLFKRLKSMLSVDFYRLFHTPMLYIFLVIAAIIPAMVVSMTRMSGEATGLYSNVWEIIAAAKPLYMVTDMGQYANMNMVFIFGGIMVSIFIGHDYKSGYVKQLFTTHPKKQDYMISKTLSCTVAMILMCVTYFIGGVVGGAISGLSFEVNVGSLIIAILGKMIMSLGWASFYTFLNVIFRKYFGISIASSFFFGTGLLIVLLGGLFGNSPALNIFLYGSSVNACLSSNFLTLIICIACSLGWAIVYNVAGSIVLKKSDVY